MAKQRSFLSKLIWLGLLGITVLSFVAGLVVIHLQQNLPDVEVLKDMQLQVPLRVYTQDKQLIAEYGEKRRIPVPLQEIPQDLINAVLATEDSRFYQHTGVDFLGLARAALRLVVSGHAEQGGSTITMQVARNFFLTPKKTILRKVQEILLAIKIDRELSKEKILELYLNKIYFGQRAYGVAAAAYTYFGKSLDELTLAESALIAGLPKAPSSLNPIRNPEGAKKRRNHVLKRMYEQKYITEATMKQAQESAVVASYHGPATTMQAPYIAEMVRQALMDHFGEDIYTQGINVYTTIDSKLQKKANEALKVGLRDYDQRHGYHGPLKRLGNYKESRHEKWLKKIKHYPSLDGVVPAAIKSIDEEKEQVTVLFGNDTEATLSMDNLRYRDKPVKELSEGWIVYLREDKKTQEWQLDQLPNVEGALVALAPQNGAILALSGGYDYFKSKFNRAVQAERQPGSSFKPFIYAAALARGYHLATIINDAPIEVVTPGVAEIWKPRNDSRNFNGPTRLRMGLVRSRNLVSIRLLDAIGVDYAVNYIEKFGFEPTQLPHSLSLALGTGDTTPLQLAAGYAVFANGGFQVTPYVIDHITDAKGNVIYQMQPASACRSCETEYTERLDDDDLVPSKQAPRAISPQVAYLITDVLQDVVQTGTGRRAMQLGRHDLAGKTGTTNDQRDGWFAGYTQDLVLVTWVGYDQPRSLHEYGSQTALPIWIDFMELALRGKPQQVQPRPRSIVQLTINPETGLRVASRSADAIDELFVEDSIPATYRSGEMGVYIDPDTGIDHAWHHASDPLDDLYMLEDPDHIDTPLHGPAPVEEPESYEQLY